MPAEDLEPKPIIEKLAQAHSLAEFDCSNTTLDTWLKRYAWTNQGRKPRRRMWHIAAVECLATMLWLQAPFSNTKLLKELLKDSLTIR